MPNSKAGESYTVAVNIPGAGHGGVSMAAYLAPIRHIVNTLRSVS